MGLINYPPLPFVQATRKAVCPVCEGKTVKRRGFYPDSGAVGGEWVKCRSCSGRGVV